MKRLFRAFLFLLFLAAVAAAIAYAFWPQPVEVELVTVTRGLLTVTVDDDGKTRVQERYVVSAPLAGRLLRVDLDPGDPVIRGKTLLAQIQPHEPDLLDARTLAQAEAKVRAAQAALDRAAPALTRAQLELDYAETELARLRGLEQKQAVAKDILDEAETRYRTRQQDVRLAEFAQRVAQFELEMAQAALLRARPAPGNDPDGAPLPIASPITGRVLRVFQESATVVAAGTPLLEVGNPENLEVEVDVLSSDGVKIRPHAKVWLEQWGGDEALEGTVRLVEPSAFTKVSALGVEEQRVNVIIDLRPGQQASTLADGFRVEARIVIWEQDHVLQVPTGALFRRGDDWAVFVAEQDSAVLRTIRIGHRNSLSAEVLDGLREGEAVILHPSDKVRDGVGIRHRTIQTR